MKENNSNQSSEPTSLNASDEVDVQDEAAPLKRWGRKEIMNKAIILYASLLSTVISYAGINETPESLTEKFIAVVNTKDKESHHNLIHPKCYIDLSLVQQQFLTETLNRDFSQFIPENRKIRITKLQDGELPFATKYDWAVKPTHQFKIDFTIYGHDTSTSIVRFIAKEGKNWVIIAPMLNEENLKKYIIKNEELDIRYDILSKELMAAKKNERCYISFGSIKTKGGKYKWIDPPSEFLKRFKGRPFFAIKATSCPKSYKHPRTGTTLRIHTVTITEWINPQTVKIRYSRCAGLCGYGYNAIAEKKNEQWEIKERINDWTL